MRQSIEAAAHAVNELSRNSRQLVAVDGVDGAGKSTFADRLSQHIARPVIRASVDDFHKPRVLRYRRGRESPAGFYLDSFDLSLLRTYLLTPFAAGQDFRLRAFDHHADVRVEARLESAAADAVLLLDGLFLHREELRQYWDLSILLDVPAAQAAKRLQQRDGQPTRQRYVRGTSALLRRRSTSHARLARAALVERAKLRLESRFSSQT